MIFRINQLLELTEDAHDQDQDNWGKAITTEQDLYDTSSSSSSSSSDEGKNQLTLKNHSKSKSDSASSNRSHYKSASKAKSSKRKILEAEILNLKSSFKEIEEKRSQDMKVLEKTMEKNLEKMNELGNLVKNILNQKN